MFRFFESIAMANGIPRNLFFHQARVDKTFKHFYPKSESHHLEYLLSKLEIKNAPLVKCKFSYNDTIFKFYQSIYTKKIFTSFQMIQADTLEYSFKFTDRSSIDKLLKHIPLDHQAIFIKKKFITDSGFSNLIFFDGYRWLTPARPLLAGTMRASLLSEMSIHEENIEPKHLRLFKSFKLINALNSFENETEYPIASIQSGII